MNMNPHQPGFVVIVCCFIQIFFSFLCEEFKQKREKATTRDMKNNIKTHSGAIIITFLISFKLLL